jgi:carbamoyl-phosphate synthase large subunit
MNVCSNTSELERFLTLATEVSKEYPVVVSEFIEEQKRLRSMPWHKKGAGGHAISEHVEFAGVHSGDATIQFPPQKIYTQTVRRIKRSHVRSHANCSTSPDPSISSSWQRTTISR